MRAVRGLVLAALAWGPAAWAAEYRAFTLSDGRTFVAEVLTTEATGMKVRIPQGATTVPFLDLADMVPVEESAFDTQDPLYVYVAADGPYRAGFQATYKGRPGVTLLGDADPILSGDERRAAAICGTDLDCVVDALDGNARWIWVVVGRMEGADAVLEGAVTKGATRTRASALRTDVEAIARAGWDAILVTPAPVTPSVTPKPVAPEPVAPEPVAVAPEPAEPPEPREPREPRPLTARRAVALSFVPVPGYPAAVAGDWTGFGIGLAVAVPTTFVWMGATGKSAQSPAGHVLLGLGGYYAATVVTNQVLSATRLQKSGLIVGVGPTGRGQGAQVTVTLSR